MTPCFHFKSTPETKDASFCASFTPTTFYIMLTIWISSSYTCSLTDLATLLMVSCPVSHTTWRDAFWPLGRCATQVCGFVKETQNRLACQIGFSSDVCFNCYTVMKLAVINGVCWSQCSSDSRSEECIRVTACRRGERGGRSPRGPQGPNNWMSRIKFILKWKRGECKPVPE